MDGVERDPALQARGLVAEPGGHPGVGALVEGEREEEDDEFKEGEDEVDTGGFQKMLQVRE